MYLQVQVVLFDPKSINNCIIFLFRAGGAKWCLLTIIIYCYELVTTENIIHSFTICILCRTQHHAMLPRPQGGDYEFKLAFEIIPKWEGWDTQNIFWCQLPTGTWHWHQDDRMKTGNWCGETGTVMGSLTIPTVLTINAFSYSPPVQFATLFVKIILFCLWCWELEPNAANLGIYDVRLHIFAETNYISDFSHPYLSTGQLGGNSYDNWKLRSDFN